MFVVQLYSILIVSSRSKTTSMSVLNPILVHHGDGSQDIACRLNESEPYVVGYFSLHDIYSFPCENGNLEKISDASVSIAAHGSSQPHQLKSHNLICYRSYYT